MSYRRSPGIPSPRKEEKPVGRPVGCRKESGVYTTIRVNDNVKAILESERKPDERYNDTIERLFYEKAQTIQALRRENDELRRQ